MISQLRQINRKETSDRKENNSISCSVVTTITNGIVRGIINQQPHTHKPQTFGKRCQKILDSAEFIRIVQVEERILF